MNRSRYVAALGVLALFFISASSIPVDRVFAEVSLTRTLSRGMSGADVQILQRFLIMRGFLAQGNVTGYFGSLTEAGVRAFQSSNGIVYSGTGATTGYGVVGPKTRLAIVRALQVTATPPQSPTPTQSTSAVTQAQITPVYMPPPPPTQIPVQVQPQSTQTQTQTQTQNVTPPPPPPPPPSPTPSPTPSSPTPNPSPTPVAQTVAPSASLSATPSSGTAPFMTNLSVSSHGGTNCAGGTYLIDWGDGSTPLSFPVSQSQCANYTNGFSHVYTTGGTFTITFHYEGTASTQVTVSGGGIPPYIGSWPASYTGNIFGGSYAVESSLIWFAGSMRIYYQCNSNSVCAKPLNSDTMTQPLSPGTQIVPGKCRFPFVFDGQNGTYYLACGLTDDLGDVYLYQSQDGLNSWQMANNGKPIIRQSGNLTGISNVAILPVNGTWHMLVEGAYGLWYSSTPSLGVVNEVNFNTNLTSGPVIANGGNADLKLSADGRSLVAIHGVIADPNHFNGSWYVTVSTASLSSPTLWTSYSNTYALGASGIDIADPSVVGGPSGAWITVSYAQNSLKLLSAENGLQKFVNALVAPVTLNVPAPPTSGQ